MVPRIAAIDDGIWLVSSIYYVRPGAENLATLRQPVVRREIVTHVLGTTCYRCLRAGQFVEW